MRAETTPQALARKAQQYQARMPEHTPGYGMIVEVEYTDETLSQVRRFHGYRDASIWTGCYLASQCWRYEVTRDPAALAEIERMVLALHRVKAITGTPGYIGRYVAPNEWPFNDNIDFADEDNLLGRGEYEGDYWITFTSRDMYIGWWFGMWQAAKVVQDPQLLALIRRDARELIDGLERNGFAIITETGLASASTISATIGQKLAWYGMAADILGEQRYRDKFSQAWAFHKEFIEGEQAGTWLSKHVGYYAFNLNHMTSYPLLGLINSRDRLRFQRLFRDQVRVHVEWTWNAWFDLFWLDLTAGSSLLSDEEEVRLREHITESLLEFPECPNLLRQPDQGEYVLDPETEELRAIAAQNPALAEFVDPDYRADRPFRHNQRCLGNFAWQRDPNKVRCGGGNPREAMPGVDYLCAYWLARKLGVVEAAEPLSPALVLVAGYDPASGEILAYAREPLPAEPGTTGPLTWRLPDGTAVALLPQGGADLTERLYRAALPAGLAEGRHLGWIENAAGSIAWPYLRVE